MCFSEEFIALCMQTMRREDYGDKAKRKLHNKTMDKLIKLSPQGTVLELEQLLMHEDSRVRINAAAACRERNLLIEKTVETLRDVIVHEADSTLKFSAAMLLKQYMED